MVGFDGLERNERGVQVRVREKPAPGRQRIAEPGVLRHHRAAGREEGGAAVAEPTRAQADVLVLGRGQLAARALDEGAVRVGAGPEPASRTIQPCASSRARSSVA